MKRFSFSFSRSAAASSSYTRAKLGIYGPGIDLEERKKEDADREKKEGCLPAWKLDGSRIGELLLEKKERDERE